MAIDFQITTGSNVPIYRQIVDQVRLALASGEVAPGEQLPSVRVLAERLLVNPNTVAHAYAELTRHGVIESAPGRGVFIAERRQVFSKSEQGRRLDRLLQSVVSEMMLLDLSRDELVDGLDRKLRKLGFAADTSERRGKR